MASLEGSASLKRPRMALARSPKDASDSSVYRYLRYTVQLWGAAANKGMEDSLFQEQKRLRKATKQSHITRHDELCSWSVHENETRSVQTNETYQIWVHFHRLTNCTVCHALLYDLMTTLCKQIHIGCKAAVCNKDMKLLEGALCNNLNTHALCISN